MSSFTIAWKDMKIRLLDRKGFIMLLIMPIVLTAILGSALSGLFGESGSIPETSVGIVVSSNDDLTEQFMNKVLQDDELKESITLKIYETEVNLKIAMEHQEIDVGIILPFQWGEGLIKGDVKEVMILTDPEKEIQSAIIESITEAFVSRVASVSIATEVVAKEFTAIPVSNQDIDVTDVISRLANELSDIAHSNINIVTSEKNGKEPISAMQYYAAAMCAMFVLFNITIGAKSIIQERKTETLARLMSSPIRHSSIIIGKFLGTFYFSYLQYVVFIIATYYMFGVSWGNNILQIVVLGFAYSISVAGLSMIIASFLTDEKIADNVGGIGVQILALLGGSMLPLATFPTHLQLLANVAPNKWALESLVEIMNGTSWSSLVLPSTILTLIGLLALLISSLKLKPR